jgi:hypothetical protein
MLLSTQAAYFVTKPRSEIIRSDRKASCLSRCKRAAGFMSCQPCIVVIMRLVSDTSAVEVVNHCFGEWLTGSDVA